MSQFPIGAGITLADLEGDVHGVLHRLRAAEPVSWLRVLGGWLVTGYDHAVEVMRDAVTYTVDHPGFSTARVVGPSMLSMDGAEHRRLRTPFEEPFRRKEVAARFEQTIAQQADQLVDGFAAAGRAELRRDYAGPLAVHTMIDALGLDDVPVSTVLGWYDRIVDAITRLTAGQAVSPDGRAAFLSLREHLQPALKAPPRSNLLAAASGRADGLSDDEVLSNGAVLLFGGIETTEGMIANAFYHLLTVPHLLQSARADASLLPALIEESLRMEPAAAVVDRYAVCNVRLGDVVIKSGDLVRVSLTGANRDPKIFVDPDRFDPHRANIRTHLAFAQGPHVCLGLHLARLEAQQALKSALTTLPDLRLVTGNDVMEQARPRGLVFRKSQALHVVWRD